MKLLFWASLGLIVYTYAIYPALLLLLAAVWQAGSDARFAMRRPERRCRPRDPQLPFVSLVFAAYNEAAVIVEKMRNCAALDYPPDRLEILVGCDGCSDRTPDLARAANLPNARVLDYRDRSGKPEILNRLLREAQGEFVVFSDANTLLDSGSVRALVRHFSDPRVGCVCGELRLTSAVEGGHVEGFYWRYEVFLKFLESRLGLLLGANGGIYAIRRALYSPLPRLRRIAEDFLVAMRIRGAGHRVIYDPEAVAFEEAAPGIRFEFQRRIRIGAGSLNALSFTLRLLSPARGRVAFAYWSHKILRWLVPFALPLAFVASVILAGERFYLACACGGALLALLGAAGYLLERREIHVGLLAVPYSFFSMNLALLLGYASFFTGRITSLSGRTTREHEVIEPSPADAPGTSASRAAQAGR